MVLSVSERLLHCCPSAFCPRECAEKPGGLRGAKGLGFVGFWGFGV